MMFRCSPVSLLVLVENADVAQSINLVFRTTIRLMASVWCWLLVMRYGRMLWDSTRFMLVYPSIPSHSCSPGVVDYLQILHCSFWIFVFCIRDFCNRTFIANDVWGFSPTHERKASQVMLLWAAASPKYCYMIFRDIQWQIHAKELATKNRMLPLHTGILTESSWIRMNLCIDNLERRTCTSALAQIYIIYPVLLWSYYVRAWLSFCDTSRLAHTSGNGTRLLWDALV